MYQTRLEMVLRERIALNPRYSLRAFARDIGISPAQLSLILRAKRGLSLALAKQIGEKLRLTQEEQRLFNLEVQSRHGRSISLKSAALAEMVSLQKKGTPTFLSIDAFSVIANWYHLAILEALKIKPKKRFKTTTDQVLWLSAKLGISTIEVANALDRLLRLELIEVHRGFYRGTNDTVFTGDQVPSEAVRSFHKQVIQKALQSVETQAPADRYLRSTLTPISKQDIPKIKERVKEFHESLIREFGKDDTADSVYAFSTQAFRLFSEESEYEEL